MHASTDAIAVDYTDNDATHITDANTGADVNGGGDVATVAVDEDPHDHGQCGQGICLLAR